MSFLDTITGRDAQVTAEADVEGALVEAMSVAEMAAQLDGAEDTIELLRESMADLELMLEDRGWARLGSWGDQQFSRAGLTSAARLCRTMVVANPLLRRGVNLRIAYVWGSGVTIQARAAGGDAGQQDVNAVIQAFIDDQANRKILTGATARETNERTLGTDGNLLFALFTQPRTGRVQARRIPFDQVTEIITNPEDASEPWFYKRVYSTLAGETITAYHPDIDYQPTQRTLRFNDNATIDAGQVLWDAPVIHLAVNGLADWDFGIGDAFAGVAWARAYKEFLEDWAKLVKALSRFAWRATSDKRSKAQAAATAAKVAPTRTRVTGETNDVGAFVSMGPGQTLEAIPKTGATIDAESGRPLAAMVAAALDVPVTMLLADPGMQGNRATAETLDKPTELMAGMRRDQWADFHRRLFDYVIDAAVKAPAGPLRGTIGRDEWGRQVITLDGDTDRTIEIDWPDLTETPIDTLLKAIESADSIDKLPPLLIVKLLLAAFNVRDADEWLEQVTDENGDFKPPAANAGQAAIDAFRRGEDPASQV